MNPTVRAWFLAGFILTGASASAQTATLVNTLASRPVFAWESQGLTQTRSIAPGQKLLLPPGRFSGLGDKKTPLAGGSVYYFARFGATDGLYVLAPDQTLILNQSGRAVNLRLTGATSVAGVMANGALALGAPEKGGGLKAEWDQGDGMQTLVLEPGRLYRFVLDSPQGLGTVVVLSPWGSAIE